MRMCVYIYTYACVVHWMVPMCVCVCVCVCVELLPNVNTMYNAEE